MKNISAKAGSIKKVGMLALAGAIALPVLFAAPQAAEAAPPSHAPAWGWRNKNQNNSARRERRKERRQERRERRRERRENRRENRDDNWDNNHDDNWNESGSVDFTGTILDTTTSGTFRVRATDGRTYTVRSNGDTRRGQRVRVTGYFRNGVVIATDVDGA